MTTTTLASESNFQVALNPTDKTVKVSSVTFASISNKLVVGALSGIVGTGLIYPFDILKTKIQSNAIAIKDLFSSTYLQQNIKNVSIRSVYRGFSACLIGIAPEKAIKLATNDIVRDLYTRGHSRKIQVHEEIVAGSLAGFLQLIVTVPYEAVKIRLQMSTQPNVSAIKVLQSMTSVREVYRGFTATFYRDVPFCFLFFPLYSNLKSQQMDYLQSKGILSANTTDEPFAVNLIAGILAGAISAVTVTPADMLKTRIQQGLHNDQRFFDYARQVIQQEGYSALFKGWQARVMVIAPLYGIVSLAFEIQKKYMNL